MRIYSTLAMISSTKTSGTDVCAVTCEINLQHDPPRFELLVAKNKDISAKDADNAKRLIEIVKDHALSGDADLGSRAGFFRSVFTLIHDIQFAKWKRYANSLINTERELFPCLCDAVTRILAMGITSDFDSTDDDLHGDKYLRHQAEKKNVAPLKTVLANIKLTFTLSRKIINSSDDTSSEASPLLRDLSALCNVLATSRLFRSLRHHITRPADKERLAELFDEYSTIGSFWSGVDVLRESCIANEYREGLQYLDFKGVNEPTDEIFKEIKERHSVDYTEKDNMPKGKSCGLEDFYDLVLWRCNSERRRLNNTDLSTGWRKDWIRQYPALDMDDPSEIMHAEIKMGLHLLARGNTFPRAIGISKSPCFLCRTWFEAATRFCPYAPFSIPTSHEKVYTGWKRSRLEKLDSYVTDTMWEAFDRLMWGIEHIEIRDATVPTYRMPVEGVDEVCNFDDLDAVYSELAGVGGS